MIDIAIRVKSGFVSNQLGCKKIELGKKLQISVLFVLVVSIDLFLSHFVCFRTMEFIRSD